MNHQIVKTADGSDTIYLPELDETYHSIFGAVQEAKHVFIDNGLELIKKDEFIKRKINYITIEKFPLEKDILEKLNYSSHSNPDEILFNKIHEAQWEQVVEISSLFNILKLNADLLQSELKINRDVDIIFFDAFAPSKQSEMWDEKIFKILYNLLNVNGILITYSSAGIVKKALRSAGFIVKRLQGPPGKHHILLAKKENS